MKHDETTNGDCWCNPKVEIGEGGNVIIHHDVLLVRKKPVEVTAKVWDGTGRCYDEMCHWMGIEPDVPVIGDQQKVHRYWKLPIQTLNGEVYASVGEYVVRGVGGEFYPCYPDIFDETYEVVCKK